MNIKELKQIISKLPEETIILIEETDINDVETVNIQIHSDGRTHLILSALEWFTLLEFPFFFSLFKQCFHFLDVNHTSTAIWFGHLFHFPPKLFECLFTAFVCIFHIIPRLNVIYLSTYSHNRFPNLFHNPYSDNRFYYYQTHLHSLHL